MLFQQSSVTDGPSRSKTTKTHTPAIAFPSSNSGGPPHPPPDTRTEASSTFTFITHKSALPSLPNPRDRRSSNFTALDHGDHFHFLYSVAQSNAAARTLTNILQFPKVGFEGTAEAHTTAQCVRFFDRFLAYLVRKGIRTFHKYGTKLLAILRSIAQHLVSVDDVDSATFEHCSMYTEEKKAISKDSITQRTFSIDFISNLIAQYSVTSYEDFQRKVPTETKIQILKQMGYVRQNIIKQLIRICHRGATDRSL
jgi:hypothetical protein